MTGERFTAPRAGWYGFGAPTNSEPTTVATVRFNEEPMSDIEQQMRSLTEAAEATRKAHEQACAAMRAADEHVRKLNEQIAARTDHYTAPPSTP